MTIKEMTATNGLAEGWSNVVESYFAEMRAIRQRMKTYDKRIRAADASIRRADASIARNLEKTRAILRDLQASH